MSNLQKNISGFRLNYEKFFVGCDALETGLWPKEEPGEMDVYFANDLACVIIRLIAANRVFADEPHKHYHELAAKQGHTISAANLSVLYWQPGFVNYLRANRYARMAANSGMSMDKNDRIQMRGRIDV